MSNLINPHMASPSTSPYGQQAAPAVQEIIPPINVERFNNYQWTWRSKGESSLSSYPGQANWDLQDGKIEFAYNPIDGRLTCTLSPQKIPHCIHLSNSGKFYSNGEASSTYEHIPIQDNVIAKIFSWNQEKGSWTPCKRIDLSCTKLNFPPKLQKPRGDEIEELAVPKQVIQPLSIVGTAAKWIGKGAYLVESSRSVISNDVFGSSTPQDVKIHALAQTNLPIYGLYYYYLNQNAQEKNAKKSISNKTAKFNCWQFCLLSHIETGLLSWKAVGNLYYTIDIMKGSWADRKEARIPSAIKFGKFSFWDEGRTETLPQPGDIAFFSHKVNTDWHCAIVSEVYPNKNCFSIIESGETNWTLSVTEKLVEVDKGESVTFVKPEDVENNILDFLAYYRS